MSTGGGAENFGTVFAVNKDGSGFTLLHSFVEIPTDGLTPNSLMEGADGALYGTTSDGGKYYGGTVFKLNKNGSGFVVVHSFGKTSQDGQSPYGLAKASDRGLYGTTWYGGTASGLGYGTLFTLLPEPRSWFRASVAGSNGLTSLEALGAAGANFRLQASTSLAPSSWWEVTTNTASEVGALNFTNLPIGHPHLFYRLVTP